MSHAKNSGHFANPNPQSRYTMILHREMAKLTIVIHCGFFFFTQHVCDYNTKKKTSTTLRYNWTIWGQPSVFNPTKFGRRVLRVHVEHCWTLHFGRHLQQVMRVWKLPSIWAMGDFFPLRYLQFRDTIIHVLTNGSDHQLDAMWQWLELGNWSA